MNQRIQQQAKALTRVADDLRENLFSDAVYVTETSEKAHFFLASSEAIRAFPQGTSISLERSICKHIKAMKFHLVIDDTQSHPLLVDNPLIREDLVGAYAGFPVRDADRQVSAVVCATFSRMHRWTTAEQELLANGADEVAQVLAY